METISAKDYFNIHNDYKHVFEDYQGDRPEWKGRKTIMMSCITKEPHGGLGIEGVHFKITGSHKPTAYELMTK